MLTQAYLKIPQSELKKKKLLFFSSSISIVLSFLLPCFLKNLTFFYYHNHTFLYGPLWNYMELSWMSCWLDAGVK